MKFPRILGLAGLLLAATAFAQSADETGAADAAATAQAVPEEAAAAPTPLPEANAPVVPGNAEAGATKAGVCAACHGVDGNSADPQYPKLAGQHERYIARHLALFQSGERDNAIMLGFAAALTAQDMRDIGAYYATQKSGAGIADDTVIAQGPNQGLKFYEVGQKLYRSGDPQRGVPACMACHGPSGAGNPGPAYPHVGGQQAWYSKRRLEEYRTGVTNLPAAEKAHFDIMAAVAKPLTDEEIQALASYMQGLHPRAPATAKAR